MFLLYSREQTHSLDDPPQLLVIDDSLEIHQFIRTHLQTERLLIHSATSGDEGLRLACAMQPAVILLDVALKGMDGFSVLQRLKMESATHDIPVVMISGERDVQAKVRGLELGALDLIDKPLDTSELKARVRSAVLMHRMFTMLAQRARVDGLTGLWNRTYLDERLAREVSVAQRHGYNLSLVFCDVDRFKLLNDQYGHPFGDQVLERVARILNQGRAGDLACRYGGEEFAVILPHTSSDVAHSVADRMRQQIRDLRWVDHPDLRVTASFGVSDLAIAAPPTARSLVRSADQAMYAAKQAGRDRVVTAIGPRSMRA